MTKNFEKSYLNLDYQKIERTMSTKLCLHRFPKNMSICLWDSICLINEKYDGIPSKFFFDITQFCNAECKYCFTNAVKYNNIIEKEELQTEEIVNFLNELVLNVIYKVSIGGGEPFLKSLEEIKIKPYHNTPLIRI